MSEEDRNILRTVVNVHKSIYWIKLLIKYVGRSCFWLHRNWPIHITLWLKLLVLLFETNYITGESQIPYDDVYFATNCLRFLNNVINIQIGIV